MVACGVLMPDVQLEADQGTELDLDADQIGYIVHQGGKVQGLEIQREFPHLKLREVLKSVSGS